MITAIKELGVFVMAMLICSMTIMGGLGVNPLEASPTTYQNREEVRK